MTLDVIQKLTPRRLSRYIREGLVQSSAVSGVYWPQWDLMTNSQAEDLLGFVRTKIAAENKAD